MADIYDNFGTPVTNWTLRPSTKKVAGKSTATPTVATPTNTKPVFDFTQEQWDAEIRKIFAGHEELLKLKVPTSKELHAMKARGEL